MRRFELRVGGDVGVGVQCEARGVVAEHTADGLDVHAVCRAMVAKVCPYGIITTNRKSPVESRVLRFSVWFFILFQTEKSR